jgi:hypothetical protein
VARVKLKISLAGEYILDFPIGIPIFLFSYVLLAVLAQTSSIPLKTICIVHETYSGYATHHDEELTVRVRAF